MPHQFNLGTAEGRAALRDTLRAVRSDGGEKSLQQLSRDLPDIASDLLERLEKSEQQMGGEFGARLRALALHIVESKLPSVGGIRVQSDDLQTLQRNEVGSADTISLQLLPDGRGIVSIRLEVSAGG